MGRVFHPPQFAQLFNILLTIGVAIAFFLAGIFDYSALNHIQVLLQVLAATAILTCYISIVKVFTIIYDRNQGIGLRTKCRRDYLIGCGGVILVAFTQFFVISHPGISYEIRFTAFFTFNITSLILYFTFIWKVEKLYKVDYTWKPALIVAVFYVSLYFIVRYFFHGSFKQSGAITLCHYLYLVSGTIDTTTFVELLKGRIQRTFRENDEGTRELLDVRVEDSEEGNTPNQENSEEEGRSNGSISWIQLDETTGQEDTNSKLDNIECDKCLMKFEEKLATTTLLKHNSSHYFICPFCQQVTVVHGGQTNLPPLLCQTFETQEW